MLYYENQARQRGFKFVAGVDEAGRGPLAGPVVAAAVVLKTRRFINLIDDSKKLTRNQRLSAFDEILKKAFVGVGIVNEKVIDNLNILIATRFAMQQALTNLPISPDFILIDGKVNLDIDIPKKEIIYGDSKSLSIASASIIAKVTRDKIMDLYHRVFPGYGFDLNMGYGTKFHISKLRHKGPCMIHRRSFNKVLNG